MLLLLQSSHAAVGQWRQTPAELLGWLPNTGASPKHKFRLGMPEVDQAVTVPDVLCNLVVLNTQCKAGVQG